MLFGLNCPIFSYYIRNTVIYILCCTWTNSTVTCFSWRLENRLTEMTLFWMASRGEIDLKQYTTFYSQNHSGGPSENCRRDNWSQTLQTLEKLGLNDFRNRIYMQYSINYPSWVFIYIISKTGFRYIHSSHFLKNISSVFLNCLSFCLWCRIIIIYTQTILLISFVFITMFRVL